MKLLITLLCTAFLFACGPTATTSIATPIAQPTNPPWEALSAEDRAMYVESFACVEATRMVEDMLTWDEIDTVAVENSTNRFIVSLSSPAGLIGFYQFRRGEKNVVEFGVLFLDETMSIILIDYYVLRAIHTGAASPDNVEALNVATGEYFCVYI